MSMTLKYRKISIFKKKLSFIKVFRIIVLFNLFIPSYLFAITSMNPQSLDKNVTQGFFLKMGSAYNVKTDLKIKQYGYDVIDIDGDYETKPHQLPPYYAIGLSSFDKKKQKGWQVYLIHHKLYWVGEHSDIQDFTITNGYNLIGYDISHSLHSDGQMDFNLLIGGGIVMTHPESKVRNQKFDEHGGFKGPDTDGYFVSGIFIKSGVELLIGKNTFVWASSIETSIANASVPIAGGLAEVPNIAFHFQSGIRLNFCEI